MILVLLGVLLVLGALGWLGLVSLRTWRQVRDFSRLVGAAGDRISLAQQELEAVMALQGDRAARREQHFEW